MNPLWYSLGPLLIINIIMLATVLIYASIAQKVPADKEVMERHASAFVNRWFRGYWVWLISPIERFFVRSRITPNQLTLIGLVVSSLAGLFYAYGRLGLAGWMVILGGTFDMFD